ncbi:MAG: TM1266 family iron-only hydrogenase system putative regulator [Massiliimalia sp.]
MEKRIALVGIIVEDSSSVERMNEILHEYGDYIVGRMGVPYRERGIHVISIIVDATNDVISSMSGKLGKLKGIRVKTVYQKETEKETK